MPVLVFPICFDFEGFVFSKKKFRVSNFHLTDYLVACNASLSLYRSDEKLRLASMLNVHNSFFFSKYDLNKNY